MKGIDDLVGMVETIPFHQQNLRLIEALIRIFENLDEIPVEELEKLTEKL